MKEWVDEWMNQQTNKPTNQRSNEQMNKRTNEWMKNMEIKITERCSYDTNLMARVLTCMQVGLHNFQYNLQKIFHYNYHSYLVYQYSSHSSVTCKVWCLICKIAFWHLNRSEYPWAKMLKEQKRINKLYSNLTKPGRTQTWVWVSLISALCFPCSNMTFPDHNIHINIPWPQHPQLLCQY